MRGLAVKRSAARPQRKAAALRRPSAKPLRARADQQRGAEGPERAKALPRAAAKRLAAEVERLAAQLEQSRARIVDLEAKVDIDPLTDLLNRRGFERELKRSVAYVKRYGTSAALLFLDLDGFKPVNDRHGHAAGDAVLKAVAAALVRHVRASDVVARLGGDEFVVLLWNVERSRRRGQGAPLWSGRSMRRRCSGAPRRWWSARRPACALIGALDTPADAPAPTRHVCRASVERERQG